MSVQPIRIGVVGLGRVVRERYVPGFRAIDGVELVGVCNSTRQSSERAAAELGIPNIYDNWMDLVEAEEADAVLIGTCAKFHCPVTLAALENGKHVLCETSMAMNAEEAHAMFEAAKANPQLVAHQIPSAFSYQVEPTVQERIASGYLGEVLAIEMQLMTRYFVDPNAPFGRGHNQVQSGYNIGLMAGWYECLMRMVGPASKVLAMTKIAVPQRRDAGGVMCAVTVPEHVDILCQMASGPVAHLRFGSLTGLARRAEGWFFGSEGTLRMEITGRPPLAGLVTLHGGQRGDRQLEQIEIPPEKEAKLRVEEAFVNTIRGLEPNTTHSLEEGVQTIEFVEAVTRSAQSGEAISLPL